MFYTKKIFRIFAQNLGYYNDGYLVGGWIDLPQSPERIQEFLKDKVKIDENHEEYEIADVDEVPFPYESIQWASLEKINNLALIYNTLTDYEKEAVMAHIVYMEEEHYDIDELINICLQANDISYFQYDFEGIEYNKDCSPTLKLGYTMAEENGIYDELEKLNILNFFDFEEYGNSFTYDYETFDNGYLIPNYNIDLNYFSENEIQEKIDELLKNNDIEKEDIEVEI